MTKMDEWLVVLTPTLWILWSAPMVDGMRVAGVVRVDGKFVGSRPILVFGDGPVTWTTGLVGAPGGARF